MQASEMWNYGARCVGQREMSDYGWEEVWRRFGGEVCLW